MGRAALSPSPDWCWPWWTQLQLVPGGRLCWARGRGLPLERQRVRVRGNAMTVVVPSNKRMELSSALAPAPRINAAEGHFACAFTHRALAAHACWADADQRGLEGAPRRAAARSISIRMWSASASVTFPSALASWTALRRAWSSATVRRCGPTESSPRRSEATLSLRTRSSSFASLKTLEAVLVASRTMPIASGLHAVMLKATAYARQDAAPCEGCRMARVYLSNRRSLV